MRSLKLSYIIDFFKRNIIVIIALTLVVTSVASSATIFPAGSLLQPNDVTSSHIRDNAIVDVDVNSNAQISGTKVVTRGTQGSVVISNGTSLASTTLLTISTSTPNVTINATTTLQATTTINGVSYYWPNTQGSTNTVPQNDGSGNISWVTNAPSTVQYTFTSGESLTAGQPVFVAVGTETTQSYTNGFTNTSSQNIGLTSNSKKAQRISIGGSAINIKQLKISVWRNNNPADSVKISIFTDNAGAPSSTEVASSTKVGSSLQTSATTETFTFASSVTLSANTDYWIVFDRTSSYNDTNYYLAGALIGSSGRYWNGSSWVSSAVDVLIVGEDIFTAGRVYKTDANVSGFYNAFVGFANSTVSSGASIAVNIAGVDVNQTGLSIGSFYYLSDTAGAIQTSAGTNSRKVGIAISTTRLLITNSW
ncbi:MAG: choice-of-anchor R domain-containing protein [Minisyncoccota bacterium]